MLEVVIPNDKTKIKQLILALESLLLNDNAKDKEIHQEALHELRKALD